MLQPWINARIIDIQDETPTTRRFWLQIAETDNFIFEPGQFVTLDLPIHEQKNKRWRSYSIASAPNGTNIIELIIVLLQGGAGTHYLFNEVTIGNQLLLRGPQGKFTLPPVLDKDIFLICTGTGIAPFRSMVNYIYNKGLAYQNIHLIFGCRKLTDVLYKEELTLLTNKMNGFYYHPVFSRENEVPVNAYKGYVHEVYKNILLQNKNPAYFYLCGWKNMIDDAKTNIINLGYDKKDIHLELYG